MINILFLVISFLSLVSALLVVLSSHVVFSLIFLIFTFVLSSFILLLLDCEFLSLLFIIIYVGAISVLFLFAIMMVETKSVNLYRNKIKYFPLAFIFSSIFTISLVLNVFLEDEAYPFTNNFDNFNLPYYNWYSEIDAPSELNLFADVLYTYFVLQFLFVGLILLFALVAVVFLTDTSSTRSMEEIVTPNHSDKNFNKNLKSQFLDKQLARNNVFYQIKSLTKHNGCKF